MRSAVSPGETITAQDQLLIWLKNKNMTILHFFIYFQKLLIVSKNGNEIIRFIQSSYFILCVQVCWEYMYCVLALCTCISADQLSFHIEAQLFEKNTRFLWNKNKEAVSIEMKERCLKCMIHSMYVVHE